MKILDFREKIKEKQNQTFCISLSFFLFLYFQKKKPLGVSHIIKNISKSI